MTERIVVVSSNNNPDYLFYAPYIEKAWNSLGWKVAFMITSDVDANDLKIKSGTNYIIQLPDIPELRPQTVAQAGRLYASNYFHGDKLLMTSDIDLLPLQDYWKPDPSNVTIYGHDLTWFSYYPMGYIAMSADKWKTYMNTTLNTKEDMLRDARETKIAFSKDWEEWWNHDWNLVTKRLKPFEKNITFVNRGQIQIAGGTLAKGRVDRFNWKETQNQPDLIDAHCENLNVMHPVKLEPFLEVFEKYYGKL